MYGVCAGTEKTAGRGGEDPTGRTTKEATGNSTIVTMLMPNLPFFSSRVKLDVIRERTTTQYHFQSIKVSFNSSGTRTEEAAGGHA